MYRKSQKNKSSHECNRFILTFSGRDCMDNVCRRVNLQQPDLFGLKFYSRRSYPKYRWVDLDRPLKKQLDKYAQQPTGPLHLGTIHILRKHFYSKFFIKIGFFFVKTKEFIFQHQTKFSPCNLKFQYSKKKTIAKKHRENVGVRVESLWGDCRFILAD